MANSVFLVRLGAVVALLLGSILTVVVTASRGPGSSPDTSGSLARSE